MRSSVLKKNVHLDWVLLHVRHPTKHVIGINNTYSLKGPFDLDVIAILFDIKGNSKSREVNWLDQGSGDGLCSQEFDPSSLPMCYVAFKKPFIYVGHAASLRLHGLFLWLQSLLAVAAFPVQHGLQVHRLRWWRHVSSVVMVPGSRAWVQ